MEKSIEKIFVTIGNKIKQTRINEGLTQQNLADACDMETNNISRIEHGRTNPTIKTLYKISQALNIQLKELLNF